MKDRFVALLRGINVGGHRKVSMSHLRELFERHGFTEVQTLLQSGNVVFGADECSEAFIESEVRKTFGPSIDVMVRRARDIEAIVAGNPFLAEAESDPGHLLVMFTKIPVRTEAHLSGGRTGQWPAHFCTTGERLEVASGHLYLYYPAGVGRSKLTGTTIERHFGTRATARNWNTLSKIRSLVSGSGA